MSSFVLRSARIIGDRPVDIVVDSGVITGVGSALAGSAAEVIDLGGRWVTPGLWDHHVHMEQWAAVRQRIDLSSAESAAEVGAIVREHASAHPPEPGTVLMGYGFRDGLWFDDPTPEGIAVGDIPVTLVSGDVHTVWSNSVAVRLLGLPESHWFLREQAAFDVLVRLNTTPTDVMDGWVADAARAAAARGVVGIVDLEMTDAGASWLRRRGGDFPRLRVRAAVYPDGLDAAVARGQGTDELLDGTDGLLVGGPFKIFTDGSLNTRTAYCYEPYPGLQPPDDHGLATHAPAELVRLGRLAHAHGLTPTIHAIGDTAVTLALDAFEAIGGGGSIEHAQLLDPADLPRFARLGVIASVQPEHAIDDRDVADRYWAGRTDRAFAYRSLLDAGARLQLGSDAPVAPLDPWVAISAAVTRTRDGREPWHPEQRITVDEALAASVRSSIAVGQPADLAILDSDPHGDPAALRELPVAATLLAGEWTHSEL